MNSRIARRMFWATFLFVAADASTALAQSFTCVANAAVPPSVRPEGRSELVADVVLQCSGNAPATGINATITLFFNTDVTSRLLGGVSEAVLLIGEPAPATQALGVNLFQATISGPNSITFSNVPVVSAPGGNVASVLRITNVRLNATPFGGVLPTPLIGSISTTLPLPNPTQTVAFVASPLAFSAAARCTAGTERTIDLRFSESFPTEFKLRGGDGQSTPGTFYNTESGFTPDPVIAGVGTADSGTRLSALISGIASSTQLSVPAVVTSGALTITAVSPAGGGLVPIVGGTATIIYEVTATTPLANEAVLVPVTVSGAVSGLTVKGNLAPISTAEAASSTEPIPRFADRGTVLAVAEACSTPVPTTNRYALTAGILMLLVLGAACTRRFSRR